MQAIQFINSPPKKKKTKTKIESRFGEMKIVLILVVLVVAQACSPLRSPYTLPNDFHLRPPPDDAFTVLLFFSFLCEPMCRRRSEISEIAFMRCAARCMERCLVL